MTEAHSVKSIEIQTGSGAVFVIDTATELQETDLVKEVHGFIGSNKEEGTVLINLRLNKVGFRDKSTYELRTAMAMSYKKIMKIAQSEFHLFPNAGKNDN